MGEHDKKINPNTGAAGGANHQDGDPEASTATDQNGVASAQDQAATTPGDPAAEVQALREQVADLTDRLLRAHAEMDNMRKRSEKERTEIAKYAISGFAKDVVQVGDNFQRAIDAVPPDAAEGDPALKSFLEGVTMTEREFLKVLERHGVRRIDPAGEVFNPHYHQAMMEREDKSVPQGTILQVFQPGYVLEDRVLRPAMVIVAKGGEKTQSGTANANARTDPASDATDGAAPELGEEQR